MKRSETYPIDRAEVLRYLHCEWEDKKTKELLDCCEAQVRQAATPRSVFRMFPLTYQNTVPTVRGMGWELSGQHIKTHLQTCTQVVFFAATIGDEIDRIIRTAQVSDMAHAVALDCVASVLIEAFCNAEEEALRLRLQAEGLFLTSRFSPGYGDFPLTVQKPLLAALEAEKRIGLFATAEQILVPRKSVTAVLGVADHPVTGALAGCESCALQGNCRFLKKGTTCFKPTNKGL